MIGNKSFNIKGFKQFNESVDDDLKELKEFCNQYLSYIRDIGLGMNIDSRSKLKSGKTLFSIVIGSYDIHKYSDIKDDLIQFITFLENSYCIRKEIENNKFIEVENTYDTSSYLYLNMDELERLADDFKFNFISLYVIKK